MNLDSGAILGLWLGLLFAKHAWETVLDVLNLRHSARSTPAPELGTNLDAATHARAQAYTRAHGRLRIPARWTRILVIAALVVTGAFGWVDEFIARLVEARYLHGLLLIGALSILAAVVDLPFGLYRIFTIERHFGFNTMTWRTLLFDLFKGAMLGVALGVPLLLALFALVDRGGELWWLWAFGVIALFQIVVSALYPSVIAPLFNKFSPLPDTPLRHRLAEMASQLEFPVKELQVMDGSRRSRHSNAYFAGLGRAKRIVLFDTLIEQLSEGELTAVLAHEIGHEKRRHVLKRLAVSLLLLLGALFVGHLALPVDSIYQAFGFADASGGIATLLVIANLVGGPLLFVLNPLFSGWSRRQEFDADRFAVRAMGGAEEMAGALIRLSKDNLSNVAPHPWYSTYHYSHPPLLERLRALSGAAGTLGTSPATSTN
jgi:STE24 endopeptidase